ncbi:MAG: MBL fold metallo-hydrolase [Lysobacterales bacterium]|jgi:L-ascorbate metabolism protein UlaG (beta-lactamase superfamily)
MSSENPAIPETVVGGPARPARVVMPLLLAVLLFAHGALLADVTITKLANEGIVISDGQHRVMIDGLVVEPYAVYGGLPPEDVSLFDRLEGPFKGIDIALVSHRHHEHNQPDFACRFLQKSTATRFYSSSQVIDLMREKCRKLVTTSSRIITIAPDYDHPFVLNEPWLKLTVFPLSHGTRKYAKIQNNGHLVEMGGVKILHVGDAAMDPTDFERAGLRDIRLDVALIPFLYFQPGPGADLVQRYLNAPTKIAVHIPPGELAEVKEYMSARFPDVLILEKPLETVRVSASAPPTG